MKDPKKFAKDYKLKKSQTESYSFDDTKAMVSSQKHDAAERTASPQLINYLKNSVNADIQKISLAKGTLTLRKKDQGL